MNTRKLIRKAREYLNAGKKKQRKQRECMMELLQKLRRKERQLKEKIGLEKDDRKRREIKTNLDVILAQRKKGVALLKALKKKGKS